MSEFAYFEGKIVPVEEANLNIKTNSFHYGTCVFEGIRAYYNTERDQLYILFAKEHYERLIKNAKAMFMNLKESSDELVEITKEILIKSNIKEDVYIRPIAYFKDLALTPKLLSFTPTIAIYPYKFGAYLDITKGIHAKVSSWRRNSDNSIPSRWKVSGAYVNSALAKTEALLDGFDEAILLNEFGQVSEGSGENIFIVRDNTVITPPKNEGILEGITRKAVIRLLRQELFVNVEERPISRSELYSADEVFLTGTAAEITPVIKIDHRPIGNGSIGSITSRVQNLYFNAVRGNVERYLSWLTSVYER